MCRGDAFGHRCVLNGYFLIKNNNYNKNKLNINLLIF